MFRRAYEQKTPQGIEAQAVWSKGEWVDDVLTYDMLMDYLKQYEPKAVWVLVAVVRRFSQVPLLDKLLAEYGRSLECVLHFPLSEEAAIERMSLRRICPKCKADYHLRYKKPKNEGVCDHDGEPLISRDDDKPAAISNRIRNYNETIKPILDEYRQRGILVEVDAAPPIEEVWSGVKQALGLTG